MVYYQSTDEPHASSYWKLEHAVGLKRQDLCNLIQARGTSVPKSATKATAQRIRLRLDRGLMLYERQNVEDLRIFCFQRGIAYQPQDTKRLLVQTLETADERATFQRFMELPPELRVVIYGLHIDTLPHLTGSPLIRTIPPPPICQTSSLVRTEALPIFYDKHRMLLEFDAQYVAWLLHTPHFSNLLLAKGLKLLFDAKNADILARYRHFTLVADFQTKHVRLIRFRCDFDLAPSKKEYRLQASEAPGSQQDLDWQNKLLPQKTLHPRETAVFWAVLACVRKRLDRKMGNVTLESYTLDGTDVSSFFRMLQKAAHLLYQQD